jgi:hypothetical protein
MTVLDEATRNLLQEIVRRESLSLLSYVGDAYPWAQAKSGSTLNRLKQMVAEEREAVAALGRFLTRRRAAVGYIGSYPSNFTTINFLGLRHVLTRLVEWEKESVSDLQHDLGRLRGDVEARPLVEKLLAAKREHLANLEILAGEQAPSTVT